MSANETEFTITGDVKCVAINSLFKDTSLTYFRLGLKRETNRIFRKAVAHWVHKIKIGELLHLVVAPLMGCSYEMQHSYMLLEFQKAEKQIAAKPILQWNLATSRLRLMQQPSPATGWVKNWPIPICRGHFSLDPQDEFLYIRFTKKQCLITPPAWHHIKSK